MAPSKRSSNTQQNTSHAAKSSSAKKAAPKNQAPASGRGKASSAASTAAARSSGARGRTVAAAREPERDTARSAQSVRTTVLDDDARHDIAGVVIAVVGVATLIAVLTPTSGMLTRAVSDALHAVLGLGAFLLPVCLLLWAATFFIRVPSLIPGRVAIGLCLIALAAMGIVGLCTPGCEADPARLFNHYVLADRGGYVGNGLAWLLLTLTGKTVGIVVLAGVVIAGFVVIGLNVSQALQSVVSRARVQRAYSRARSEERRTRSLSTAWEGPFYTRTPGAEPSLPRDYAPTALFDPSRPLSSQTYAPVSSAPYAVGTAPTSYISSYPADMPHSDAPYSQPVYPPSSSPVKEVSGARRAASSHFGCGNTPGMACPPSGVPAPTTFLQPEPVPGDDTFLYSAQPAEPVPIKGTQPSNLPPQDSPEQSSNPDCCASDAIASSELHKETPRPASRRARNASSWWDPADDWKRDDFDPRDAARPSGGAPLPGVLPGAPTSADDLEVCAERYATSQVSQPHMVDAAETSEIASELVRSRTVDADDDVASRVSARTRAALEAGAASLPPVRTAPVSRPQPQAKPRAADVEDVELPWEPARVNAPSSPSGTRPDENRGAFILPDPSIMQRSQNALERSPEQQREAAKMASLLQATLTEFGVKGEVVKWIEGPTCTTYEVNPGEGVRVSRFTGLEDDIARALARSGVRIYAPVPGTSYVGIEVPNNTRQTVFFGDVLPYVDGGPLDFAVGLDANGKPVHVDLAKLPHILVAGTTGSGKSVMVNTIVMSMLMRDTPDEVRLIMIDPKQVEFNDYNGIPHLVMPVVTDMRQAAAALQWGVTEMDRRYRVFSGAGVRDLKSYNKLVQDGVFANDEFPLTTLPSIVIVIDELADLMMVAKKDVEASIVRIAQLGRACGIHLVMATQSPRADVVTGLIRANVANRIGLKVAKSTDSKIVIDQGGAEKLLGNGDMLFLQTAWGDRPRRIQGCWISDNEIAAVVAHLKEQASPEYNYQMAPLPGSSHGTGETAMCDASDENGQAPNDDDPLAWEAARLVVENQMGSTSMIQRRLKLGYARAGRVMDMLEEMGVVGPARGSKPRDVLIRDLDELATLRGGFDGAEGDL